MNKGEKEGDKSEATLEALRISFTDLTQDEFISACGISRSTYHRWIAEKRPPRLTPEQIAKICRVCEVSINIFFQQMGINLDDTLKTKSLDETKQRTNSLSEENQVMEPDSLEIAQVKIMVIAAKKLKVSLKVLFSAFGIDTDGIPDDYPQLEQPASEQQLVPPEEVE